ncbi:hypothetical protein EV586_105200 [Tumebacillus sp. BK434]|nr:hypothetical protein EV586_105200 [Tumebacillus sp. BK434]
MITVTDRAKAALFAYKTEGEALTLRFYIETEGG